MLLIGDGGDWVDLGLGKGGKGLGMFCEIV